MVTNRFYLRLATEILIYGLLAMSLDVLLGYTGLLSFMHAVYMGIAAYTVALYLKFIDPTSSLWLLMLLGVGATILIALPIGWLQVRTGGFAFALLTIAFGMMLYTIVWKARNVTGGDDGLIGIPSPDIHLGGLVLGSCRDPVTVYSYTLITVIVCFTLPDGSCVPPSAPSWNLSGRMRRGLPSSGSMCTGTSSTAGCWPVAWPE